MTERLSMTPVTTVGELVDYLASLPRDMKVFEYWESHSPGHPGVEVITNGLYFQSWGVPLGEKILLIGSD